jgi:hypothetical protein
LSLLFRNGVMLGMLSILLMFFSIKVCIRLHKYKVNELFLFQCSVLCLGILIASSFGVVMESPFGYIPFTISFAYVLSRSLQLGAQNNS